MMIYIISIKRILLSQKRLILKGGFRKYFEDIFCKRGHVLESKIGQIPQSAFRQGTHQSPYNKATTPNYV